jgi:predicted TIM-barrel fold metal-dependent hydrolase
MPGETRVVDGHGHLGYYHNTRIIPTDAEAMIRVMDRVGVEKICVSSFLSIGPDCKAGNDMVADAINKSPDRFIGYGVVNPNRPQEIDSELRRCFENLGMRAIKLHPVTHQVPIDGSAYQRVFDFAANQHLPILSHDWGKPAFLDRLASDYPDISFIIAHTGFWDGRSDFAYAGVIGCHDNVYLDLAYSNIFYEALERLVALIGAPKIVFGSDFPLHDLGYQLGRVIFARLSTDEKQKILGLNMLRIIGEL